MPQQSCSRNRKKRLLLPGIITLCLLFGLGGLEMASALRCYTCDNEGSGELCINNPAAVENGVNECQDPKADHCYTSRIEYDDGTVQLNRQCCYVKDGSSVCPPGPDDQWIVNDNPPWRKHLIRCSEDLCNSGTGDGTDDSGGGGKGGNIIVEGRANAGNPIFHSSYILTLMLTSIVFVEKYSV